MSTLTVNVDVQGLAESAQLLQAVSNALARRGPLHANMAIRGKQLTQDYLRNLNRHRSADLLGASPTGHLEKSANAVESTSDDAQATITIPRRTGLGRAFGDVTIAPGTGKKYLTIPACAETYGKSAGDFGPDEFGFAVIKSFRVFLALVWKNDGGSHKKGEVAYWLKASVTQRQDRTLLPSDNAYQDVGRRAAIEYLTGVIGGDA